jgi:hypothetical protein
VCEAYQQQKYLFFTSLTREKFDTRKCSVGPRGIFAKRKVTPLSVCENIRKWLTLMVGA